MGGDEESLQLLHQRLAEVWPAMPAWAATQSGGAARLWSLAEKVAHCSPDQAIETVAGHHGVAHALQLDVDVDGWSRLPPAVQHHSDFVPLHSGGAEVLVAMVNPWDRALTEKLRFVLGKPVVPVLAAVNTVQLVRSKLTPGRLPPGKDRPAIVREQTIADDENAIAALARGLLQEAARQRASDVHIQPFLGGGLVRIRVDGVLRRVALLPEAVYAMLVRYIKSSGSMDPSNARIPQDGRWHLAIDEREFDLRISTLPAIQGERVVMRLLEQGRSFSLKGSGFALAEVQALRRLTRHRSGLVLMTGPTGSGKTSTLFALLSELNSVERNILTVENPVEYTLPGLTQIDINEKAGLTFASVLRSTLRQDPDIVLVGEIRDAETAGIALQAAMTGHLVFSTLHTNDALSTVLRLLDLGVDRTVLADALAGVVAQRLCRRLCLACRVPATTPLRPLESEFQRMTRVAPAYRPVGCEHCGYTGYHGRLPIAEIVTSSAALRQAILSGDTDRLAQDLSGVNSLASLSSSVTRHIMSGDTSVQEAVDVLGIKYWSDLSSEYGEPVNETVFVAEETQGGSHRPTVLLLSRDPALIQTLALGLSDSPYAFAVTPDSEQGCQKLIEDESIVYVLVDIDDAASDEQAANAMRLARQHLSWSRLPALLLVAPNRESLEARIRDEGAISRFMHKPVRISDVQEALSKALANASKPMKVESQA